MRPERPRRPDRTRFRNHFSLIAILLALLFAFAERVPAAGATPESSPLSTYTAASFAQELERLKSDLDRAGKSTETLRVYREDLPKTWSVEDAGRRFEVPATPLSSRLNLAEKRPERREQELKAAREYLNALTAEVSSFSGQPTPTPDSALSKLDSILARPEYTHVRRQRSWYEELRDRINEILLRALGRLFRGVGGQTTLGYVLLWIGIAAAVVLIAYWVFRNWFRSARAAELELIGAAVPSRSWQEWVFASRDAAARSDYRMAVHCAYWAGVTRLQDLGALSADRAKTPREYLRALSQSQQVFVENAAVRREALARMTSRLEQTWYGYQAASEADFRDSLAQLEILGCHLP